MIEYVQLPEPPIVERPKPEDDSIEAQLIALVQVLLVTNRALASIAFKVNEVIDVVNQHGQPGKN